MKGQKDKQKDNSMKGIDIGKELTEAEKCLGQYIMEVIHSPTVEENQDCTQLKANIEKRNDKKQ